MHPILFTLGSYPIYSWGAVMVVSILTAMAVIHRIAGRYSVSGERIDEVVVALIFAGVAGSRLLYVLLYWRTLPSHSLLSLIDLRMGGMAFHGGLIAGLLALPLAARKLRIPVSSAADIIAPGLALGYGIQRFGCLLNGDSYGLPTDSIIGVTTRFAPGLRHPVQLYDSLMTLIVFYILMRLHSKRVKPGIVSLGYLMGSSLSRFISEFFRAGDRLPGGLTMAQEVSIVVFTGVLIAVILIYILLPKHNEGSRRNKGTCN